MFIHFKIHFVANKGEKIHLLLQLNSYGEASSTEMSCDEDSFWRIEVEVKERRKELLYKYEIVKANGQRVLEPYGYRRLLTRMGEPIIHVSDSWRTAFGDSPFMSTAFQNCYFKRSSVYHALYHDGDFLLKLFAPQIESGRHIAIVGNQELLGNWNVKNKVRLNESKYPVWSISLNVSDVSFPFEYKYVIVDTTTDEVLDWEEGPNRRIDNLSFAPLNVVTDENLTRTIPSWKGAGVAIPVFSLRSKHSFGIGDFLDMKLMVDWAKLTGQKIVQTLPINDTTRYHNNNDSYPYNAISVYALHPVYLHLDEIGEIKDVERKAYFASKRKALNDKSFVDYENVIRVKWEYCHEVYADTAPQVFQSYDFRLFFEKNSQWLVPYAVFSYLRDKFGSPDFTTWELLSNFNQEKVQAFASPEHKYHNEIAIHYFVQYHLDKQLTEVRDYARSQGVTIKGDIPIGVSPQSVDTWMEPQLFNSSVQAGAPPDDFSTTGQNWGFPTYNWELMEQDNYQWWINRFRKLADYFDAYRIDHILGFFRIWEIPQKDVLGLTGSFQPSLPFTIDELQSKGLIWEEDRFTKPYLKKHVINAIFGVETEEVLSCYFELDGWQSYKFKKEFDTQKKIYNHFAAVNRPLTGNELLMRDGLYHLHTEVLFIPDPCQHGKFHPRIAMHNTVSFKDLPDEIGRLLDNIYIDYFYHRHNAFWKEQAMKKLPALINSTSMLVCGEDLGMVPDSVPEVMNALEILSLEIQRMPKKAYHEFAMPIDAPYLSVCTTSTHDMNPIRAWWLEDSNVTQRFYNNALGIEGAAPEKCEPEIAERIVNQHLESKAMLVILPWQDWMAIDGNYALKDPIAERINVPGDPYNFWCYRMHIPFEKLMKLDDLNTRIKTMIEKSGR